MYRSGHESYCAAFETALTELEQISYEFQQMRIRKERIEGVLQALKPLVDSIDHAAQPKQSEQSSPQPVSPVIETEAPSYQPPTTPLTRGNLSSDPIQRRIDSILGLAVA